MMAYTHRDRRHRVSLGVSGTQRLHAAAKATIQSLSARALLAWRCAVFTMLCTTARQCPARCQLKRLEHAQSRTRVELSGSWRCRARSCAFA